MDNFAQLSPEEQEPYFLVAASRSKFSKEILEKDFWACWALHKLFNLPSLKDQLTFKGGASLSKAYKIIERFSEDIDISIEKSFLGFVDEKDPERSRSASKRDALLKELSQSCGYFVSKKLLPWLERDFKKILLRSPAWMLELDPQDKQALLFKYPSLKEGVYSYIPKYIKIEIGARSDHWPTESFKCVPYIKEHAGDDLIKGNSPIRVLSVERTFWEKATILHMFSHYPESKKLPIRQSRHFYDFYCLLQSTSIAQKATNNLVLLKRVAKHKSIFFRSGWAKYDKAKPGSLRLIPSKRVLDFMQADYKDMGEMFYTEPPSWQHLIDTIRDFEKSFNG